MQTKCMTFYEFRTLLNRFYQSLNLFDFSRLHAMRDCRVSAAFVLVNEKEHLCSSVWLTVGWQSRTHHSSYVNV